MPKNRKPRGGRPARNFDPRYARKSTFRQRHYGEDAPKAKDADTASAERVSATASGDTRAASPTPRRTTRAVSEGTTHARLDAQKVRAADVEGKTFADLGLGGNIVRVLGELGAERPFPIQGAAIPAILEGRDVLGRGRTGSGKTIAFGAPLVESVLQSYRGTKKLEGRAPRSLILAPTRELALQIDRTVQPIARSVGLFTTQLYGGVPRAKQVGALKRGVDIVIGTPGRIEDLLEMKKLDLRDIRITVLDEADHMAELGFIEPIQRILRQTGRSVPKGVRTQKLLFSATLDREVTALVDEFLRKPAVFEVAGETQQTGTIDHRVLVVQHKNKAEILTSLVHREGKTLVFTRTREYAEQLAALFTDSGIRAVPLHGDLSQERRTINLQKFSSGKAPVLVATDVAARGIHVDDIDLVIQADAATGHKVYMHRAGRTGRAGRPGRVITFITAPRRARMEEILAAAVISAPFEEAAPGDPLLATLAQPAE